MTNENFKFSDSAKMKIGIIAAAQELAALPYTLVVEAEEIGGEVWYVARHPELEGCLAQGRSVNEAIEALAEPRQNLIEHLLQHDLEVPLPRFMTEKTEKIAA